MWLASIGQTFFELFLTFPFWNFLFRNFLPGWIADLFPKSWRRAGSRPKSTANFPTAKLTADG